MAQGNAKKIGLDHGDLVGKDDDDHTQYLNDTRHNAAHSNIRVTLAGDQTIPNSATTQAEFDTVESQNDPDGDFTAENDGITFNAAGTYLLGLSIDWAANSTGERLLIMRTTNNGVIAGDRRAAQSSTNAAITVLVSVTAGDFFSVDVSQSSGGNLDIDQSGGTHISAMRVI